MRDNINREILFRGKCTGNGEWVKGIYSKRKTGHYTNICFVEEYKDCIIKEFSDGGISWFDVDPETVCQYTGLTAKNGKKIFEGDIVNRKVFNEFIVGQVVWFDIGFCGFYLKCGNGFYPMGKDEETGSSSCDEIIGNIFDNPELLEGGAE